MKSIKSRDNQVTKNIQKLLKSAGFRREQAVYVIEGVRLCEDALISKVKIKTVVVSDTAYNKHTELVSALTKAADEACLVSDSLFKSVSDTKSPQGIMCVCKMRENAALAQKGKFIALENIQDPSNLGTVIRTAEALGIDGMILSNDCCDIYSPKVLRGSMGAAFRIPFVIENNFTDYIKELTQSGVSCFASTPDKSAAKITDIDFSKLDTAVVLIGNEGNGLTDKAMSVCTGKVTIPMLSRAESLNAGAAASIIMWEMLRGGKV